MGRCSLPKASKGHQTPREGVRLRCVRASGSIRATLSGPTSLTHATHEPMERGSNRRQPLRPRHASALASDPGETRTMARARRGHADLGPPAPKQTTARMRHASGCLRRRPIRREQRPGGFPSDATAPRFGRSVGSARWLRFADTKARLAGPSSVAQYGDASRDLSRRGGGALVGLSHRPTRLVRGSSRHPPLLARQ